MTFRADRSGKKWVHSEKVGAFRANKSQKGGLFFAAHTRTTLIWEYTPGIAQDV